LALSTKAATVTGFAKDGAMASLGVISKGRMVASNNALVSMGLFWRINNSDSMQLHWIT